jgi:hypothetical protein
MYGLHGRNLWHSLHPFVLPKPFQVPPGLRKLPTRPAQGNSDKIMAIRHESGVALAEKIRYNAPF